MRLFGPNWYRLLVLALVFGLTCGTTTPMLWAAPQVVAPSAPEEEDETTASSAKTSASERRAFKPAHGKSDPARDARCRTSSFSPIPSTVPALPAAALRNGLATHYRC